jgi:hypothetical protein
MKITDKKGECGAEIWHGPGHQSKALCDRLGPHYQHANSTYDLYWSKRKTFSGYFDESPEENLGPMYKQMSTDAAIKSERGRLA